MLDKIQRALPQLTSARRNLAQFILEKPAEAAFLSSHELARLTGASPSTVVRLARSLGYAGFPEFQSDLQKMLIDRLSSTTRLYSTLAGRSEECILTTSLAADIEALKDTLQAISPAVFVTVAQALAQAKRIFLVGLGISATVAEALAFRLRRLRQDVHVVSRGGSDLLEPLLTMERGDVVIAIAFRRIRPEILGALDFARSQGATIVAFAESPLSSHALKADHILLTRRGPADRLNSLAVPVAVVNALGLAVSQHRGGDAALAYSWVDEFRQICDGTGPFKGGDLEFEQETEAKGGDGKSQ